MDYVAIIGNRSLLILMIIYKTSNLGQRFKIFGSEIEKIEFVFETFQALIIFSKLKN